MIFHRAALMIVQPWHPGPWLDPGLPQAQLQACPYHPQSQEKCGSLCVQSPQGTISQPFFCAKILVWQFAGSRSSSVCLAMITVHTRAHTVTVPSLERGIALGSQKC